MMTGTILLNNLIRTEKMKDLQFRLLEANEIDCRVAQCGTMAKGGAWCSVLLYKDARCDQRLLDETVGAFNWQRKHSRDNANCIVSIWDEEKKMWIEKEDTGTESNTEAEKGLASDSFKRACFNWGIGRELYTAPKIFITLSDAEYTIEGKKVKVASKVTFDVAEIGYDDKRNINRLVIVDGTGAVRFSMGSDKKAVKVESKKEPKADDAALQEAYETIADNIKSAPSREALQEIINNNKPLHQYKPFMDAVNNRWRNVQ